MTLPTKPPLPNPGITWLTTQGQQALAQYLARLDALIAQIVAGNLPGLVNAANDAAAAGVQIGQMYRNGSVVMQRQT